MIEAPPDGYWARVSDLLLPCAPMERVVFNSGAGALLRSLEGDEYLDLGAGQLCALLGHSPPALVARIQEQAGRLMHLGARFACPQLLEAAEAVVSIAPAPLRKVAFLTTGSEANEFAIRLAKLATSRTNLAAPEQGYLGTSLLLRALSKQYVDEPSAHPRVEGCHLFGVGDSAEETLARMRAVCDPVADRLAAIVLEPILGAHGIHPLPRGTLKGVLDYARRIGALFVVDEAQTGMGRTGRWFAFEHEDVVPDVLVFSKCAGGGYPVSCVVTTEDVAARVATSGFFYLSSHQADPLSLVAVSETVRQARALRAPQRADHLGRLLQTGFETVCARTPLLRSVSGRGLLLGVHCADAAEAPRRLVSRRIWQRALKHRVVMGYGDWGGTLLLSPPLCIDEQQVRAACDVLAKVCDEVSCELDAGKHLPGWDDPPPLTARFLEGLGEFRQREQVSQARES